MIGDSNVPINNYYNNHYMKQEYARRNIYACLDHAAPQFATNVVQSTASPTQVIGGNIAVKSLLTSISSFAI